jgi:TolB-like protein/tetratricopeptide (TPR) repeat protein
MSGAADHPNPKPPSVDRLSLLWRRINDHKMVQWSVAYVALAYGIQHGVELTSNAFDWPHAVERVSMLLLVLGLPLVMTLAWYHGERASRRISGPELTIVSLLLVGISLLFYAFVRPSAEIATGPAQTVQAARSASLSAAGAISIAVLPFTNLSGDAAQEFFSDGMTAEITAALAKIADLRVVGRTSAFQFKDEKKDLRTIGQALGATHILEGSVRKEGDRLRITAQLVQADNGVDVWTENYDRQLTGVFAIQEDIATSIAGALRMPLGLKPGERLVSNRTIDPESYQQYLHAQALVRARARGVPEAIKILEPLVTQNPDYAPALALLAQAYGLSPNYVRRFSVDQLSRAVDTFLPKAEAAGRRAIQLDPNLADGYLAVGRVLDERGKSLLAEDLFSKALALDPNNPDGLNQYSNLLANVGRLKQALAMKQQLRAMEPYVPVYNTATAEVLWLNGQNEAAIAILKDSAPGDVTSVRDLAMVYASMGRYSNAADVLLELPSRAKDFPLEFVAEPARLLRSAPAKAASPQSRPRLGTWGFIYNYVGAPDGVLEYYEDMTKAGYFAAGGSDDALLWHPSYAGVRKTERFKAFVRKSGYVDYWRAKGWPDLCHPIGADDFACE